MKGARRVKRRAADRHPDVVLAGRLSQAFHQAGLADPGFALDQHDLAAAVATAVPGPQQQPHLLLAPDEGCRAPGPGCGKPALDIPRRQDAPGRHRLGEPLELRCPQILEVEVIAEHRARGRADDDLVRLRQCLQTRRQVRRLADDRGFRCRSFADLVADDHRSGGDADPHRELDPGRPGGPRHSAPPSHRRCRDPPAPNARPRPHGRAGSRNRRGCRRPCTSRQSRRSAGSPHCTGSETTRSHRADLRGPSRWRVRSIPPGRKTSRSAGGARPPAPRRPRPARGADETGGRAIGAATGASDGGGAFPVSKRAAPTKASPCPPSSTARRLTISSWRTSSRVSSSSPNSLRSRR